jgi:MFS family permease
MRQDRNEFRDGWRVVLAAALGTGVGLTGAPYYTLGIFIGPLNAQFGWTRSQIAAGALCLHLGYAFVAPFVGRLIDRVGVRKVALTSLVGLVIGLLLMTQIGPSINSYFVSVVILALLGCGTIPIVWTYAVNTWFQRNRGFALSLTLTGTGVASMLAPVGVNALIANYGWQAGYLGLAAFVVVVVIPVVWLLLFEKVGIDRTAPRSTLHLPGLLARDALRTARFWQLLFGIGAISLGTGALIVHLVPLLTDAGLSRNVAAGIVGFMGMAIIVGRLSVGVLVDRLHAPYVAVVYLLFPVFGCLLLAHVAITSTIAVLGVLTIGLAAGAEVDLIAFLTSRYFGLKSYGELYGWQLVI